MRWVCDRLLFIVCYFAPGVPTIPTDIYFVFAAAVLLSDGPESQVWVPSRCFCTRHGQSLWALLRPHQAQQGQPGLPRGWLVVLHVALFPPSPPGAPQSTGQHQAGLTGLEGGGATAASSEGPPQTAPGPVMHPGLFLPVRPPFILFYFLLVIPLLDILSIFSLWNFVLNRTKTYQHKPA